MNKTEKKIRMAIQNSHLGSGKLFNKVYQDMLVYGLTAQEVAEILINNDREALNDKCNNEHTDGSAS
jgi:hypothetical protein